MWRFMTRWAWCLAVLGLSALLAVLFWLAWPESEQRAAPRWVRVEPQLVEQRLGLVGRLQAARRETVSAPFDGVVAAVLAREGQRVEKGQSLFRLDTTQLDIQLREAEAERLRTAEQLRQLRGWQSGPEVARSQRALGAARTAVAVSTASLAETRRLFERGIVARIEVESLEQLLQAQRQALKDAEQELLLTRAQGREDALLIVEMAQANAQARWQALTLIRQRKEIKAPFTGVLAGVRHSEGSAARQVQAGQAMIQGMPMITLLDLEHLQVATRVQEHDLRLVGEGQAVEAVIAGQQFAGVIEHIGLQARDDTGPVAWYDVRVRLNLPAAPAQLGLRLGMSAELTVVVRRQEQAMVLPVEALREDEAGETYVVYREQDGQPPRRVHVTPGAVLSQGVEVDGLGAGLVLLP
ncbi:HlyD family efflux transporter periplasmic adaptor subunit [Pseudomonas sp. MN1F]|nr:HlyD family efflux transporter periplasmic adaptor subunit [Pseudomonas sp. MN1F]